MVWTLGHIALPYYKPIKIQLQVENVCALSRSSPQCLTEVFVGLTLTCRPHGSHPWL